MSEEPKYIVLRHEEVIGEETKWEWMKRYNSPGKCEGLSTEIDGQRLPLWRAVCKWQGAFNLEEAIISHAEFRERFGDAAFVEAFGQELFDRKFGPPKDTPQK